MYKINSRYRIDMKDLERWKKDSIAMARELSLFEDSILETLENRTQLVLKNKSRKSRKWYGYINTDKLAIFIYKENLARFLPKNLCEICNQVGMDHLLIRHLGCHLSGTEHEENIAYTVHTAMADKRGDISPGWRITSSLLHYYYKVSPSFRSKIFYNSPGFVLL